MNADDFKKKLRELRDIRDEQLVAERTNQLERDRKTLQWLFERVQQAYRAGQNKFEIDKDFGKMSRYVYKTLMQSGCSITPKYEESALTNSEVLAGYTITWFSEK